MKALLVAGRVVWLLAGLALVLWLCGAALLDWDSFRARGLPGGTYTGQEDDAAAAWPIFFVGVLPGVLLLSVFVGAEVIRSRKRNRRH